jgi:tripartite-type tricarboxylate transporter receptor subunit TctC
MLSRYLGLLSSAVLIFVQLCTFVEAAEFPDRPVRIITQGAAGSGPDVVARLVAEELSRLWQQQVLILNHPGGGGVVAARAAAGAEPDGYTLYLPTITSYVIMPETQPKLPFDIVADFTQIGMVAETPMMIGVSPALGADSLEAFIALSKRSQSDLFYAGNNRGSLPHLTGELFRKKAEAKITFVPYAGAAAGLQDLIGGRIAMIVESVGALSGSVKGGTLKALAVASARRLANMPDLPTVAETVPGFEALGWFVLSGPARIPSHIAQRVNQDLNKALAQPALKDKLLAIGAFTRPMTPQDTVAFIRKEEQVWRPLVRQLGLAAR